MKRRQLWTGIGAAFGMLILILDSKTAISGAKDGIDLCLKTVIPALFPFFLLSNIITTTFTGSSLPFIRPLGSLCGIPDGSESILLVGFLGGYPVGAKTITQAFHSGQLEKMDAERMLAFCNNAGPAFLFGMASALFPRRRMAWAIWGIHIAGAIFTALCLPSHRPQSIKMIQQSNITLSNTMHTALHSMASVCGWVVLFRILIAFLKRWVLWLFPIPVQVGMIGILELTNGCCELSAIPDISLRFILCSGMLAFGGLCITMQTVSVTKGLSLRYYVIGKLLQTTSSLILSSSLVVGSGAIGCIILVFFVYMARKSQKKSSIYPIAGV